MPEQRRWFSPQFKAEPVQMVTETARPIAEVARDLGLHDGTLGNWVNAYRCAHPGTGWASVACAACPGEGGGGRGPSAADGIVWMCGLLGVSRSSFYY
jgi:hypothetical protein